MPMCPQPDGDKKTLGDIAGTYSYNDGCVKMKIMGSGSVGCACWYCGPMPFSGVAICPLGPNAWTNYNGVIVYVKGGEVYQACICGEGNKLSKVEGAPSTTEMDR